MSIEEERGGLRGRRGGVRVYIVQGSTGEYSGRSDWLVKGYFSEEKADVHARDANDAATAYEKKRANEWEAAPGANPFDPEMLMDYTGTFYEVVFVEVEE